MKTRFYFLIALVGFVLAVTGSDLIARMTIAGDSLADAIAGHLEWISLTMVGFIVLMTPFAGLALICASASVRARPRSVIAIFAVSLVGLVYLYFSAFQGAQQAMLDRQWTGASLAIGLLPITAGAPVILFALIATVLAMTVDRRPAI